METVPLIATPAGQKTAGLRVETVHLGQVPYVEVSAGGDTALVELSCTDAINLGLQLIAAAGEGLSRQVARALSQSWPTDLPPGR